MEVKELQRKYFAARHAEYVKENKKKGIDIRPVDFIKQPAFIYTRVTSHDHDDSIEKQTNQILEYCEVNNIEIIEHFCDNGVSDCDMENRPRFKLMIESLRPGFVVICTSISRLSCFPGQLLNIIKSIKNASSKLTIINYLGADMDTPTGKCLFTTTTMFVELQHQQGHQLLL